MDLEYGVLMPRIVVTIGQPGAGKGTQSRLLSEHFHIPQISTGDILREMATLETKLGLHIKELLEAGQLVDDEILASVVQSRTMQHDCLNGYILDGYPRTPSQMRTLEKLAKGQDKEVRMVNIVVPRESLMKRLTGRRTCSYCGEIYNIYLRPTKLKGICDTCQGSLLQRADDEEETVAKRLDAYEKMTAPLIEYYQEHGRLITVDGEREVGHVFSDIRSAIES
jgi:adenylate kinase